MAEREKMIHDSRYWKEELDSISKDIRYLTKKKRTAKNLAQTEKNIMIGCFCIRRLNEAFKLSSAFNQISLKTFQHGLRDKNKYPTYFNRNDVERFYYTDDLFSNEPNNISIKHFCNQIIHSFVFTFLSGPERNNYVMFVSDFNKKKHLNIVPISEIERIFKEASKDYVDCLVSRRDKNTKEWLLNGLK